MWSVRPIFLSVCCLLSAGLAVAPAAAAAGDRPVLNGIAGTTRGVLTPDPMWSAGLQVGSFTGFGVSAQASGVYGGALNLGLGIGMQGLGLNVSADYVRYMTQDLQFVTVHDHSGYRDLRGRLSPYVGGGVDISDEGLSLRLPIGVQYTMREDPFNFFGGLTLSLGPILGGESLRSFLWLVIGARILL